jgi:hypothetical protein
MAQQQQQQQVPQGQGHAASAACAGRGWSRVGAEAVSCSARGGTGRVGRFRRQGLRMALGAEATAVFWYQSNRVWTEALGRTARAPARMSGRMRDPGAARSAVGIWRLVVGSTIVYAGERKAV